MFVENVEHKIPEIFGFLMNSSKISSILREFWQNSDVKSSNGSIPRRHLTFHRSGVLAGGVRRHGGGRRRRDERRRHGGRHRRRRGRHVRDDAGVRHLGHDWIILNEIE